MTDQSSVSKDSYCVLYDGECPICSATAERITAGSGAEIVEKIDARHDSPIRRKATSAGLDLDYGIVVACGENLLYGADAVHFLARKSQNSAVLTLLSLPFRLKILAHILYPPLVCLRWALLFVSRRGFINNLKSETESE
jgi:predicted DCC family thiol-disulfide oxidoreductase YuxK